MRCVDKIKTFFDVVKWQLNQPIILSDIAYQLSLVEGVASVIPPADDNPNKLPVLITNKFKKSEGYSGNLYDIEDATVDGIVYTSLDPAVFEVKYPNADIQGRVVGTNVGMTTY